MAIIKCKMCGGDLDIQFGTSVAECEYCGTKQTIPTADNEKKIALYNSANNSRSDAEFDIARSVYEAMVVDFPDEAEAHWGLVLCKYGISYVDDPKSGKKIPTCHRTVPQSIFDDRHYQIALTKADIISRKIYQREAEYIDSVQKKIISIAANEDPYDVFICYKQSIGEPPRRTADSFDAQNIYTELTKDGYRVFFAENTLKSKAGSEYEPYIYAALSSAKVMLVIGSKEEFFNAVWVKNEWSRYLDMMKGRPEKKLIPCFKNMNGSNLPKEFRNLEGLDMTDMMFYPTLKEILGRTISQKTTVGATGGTQSINTSSDLYIARVFDEIECKDYESAKNALDIALTHAPNDNRVLLAATIILEDKREHFYKKYIKAVPHPDPFEIDTINDSSNKEAYLYVFYILNDIQRVKLCLSAGANPNELHEELNGIVKDRGIYTADPSYNRHDGFSTVFLDAVYKRNYDLVELMLESGASFYPEKVCPIETNWASVCANPARCAVMARIMQENDLKMLQLIAKFIPEIVNVEFSDRTDREAYDCLSKINYDFGCCYAGGIQTPLSYCIEYDIGNYYSMTSKSSLFKGCAFKPVDKVLNTGVQHRYLETTKWLIENGADINYFFHSLVFNHGEIREAGVSVLLCAVDRNNFEMVKLLVDTGKINLDDLNKSARWAVDGTIYNLLVSHGATAQRLSTTQQRSSGGCYVATAVYGSYDCPEVWTLRRFRDIYLQEHILGKLFVRFYYAISPTIVRWFGNSRAFNRINRKILDRFTALLKLKGYSDKPYDDR